MRFLARREHGIEELKRKLVSKGFSYNLINEVLSEFVESNYLNEARYVEMMIRYHYGRGQGPLKIKNIFREKQVDESLVMEGFNCFDGDWLASAIKVRSKRFGDLSDRGGSENYLDKNRQMRFLANRGFDQQVITAVFKKSLGY